MAAMSGVVGRCTGGMHMMMRTGAHWHRRRHVMGMIVIMVHACLVWKLEYGLNQEPQSKHHDNRQDI